MVVSGGLAGLGRWGRRSHTYVACRVPRDSARVWELELDDGRDKDGGRDGKPRRLCTEEELVVSNTVLLAMMRRQEHQHSLTVPREQGINRNGDGNNDVNISSLWGRILDRDRDFVTESRVDPHGVVAPTLAPAAVQDDCICPRRVGLGLTTWGASRIINGQAHVAVILPILAVGPG